MPNHQNQKTLCKWLVYGLRDPRTAEIRYVGKSCRGLNRPREHRRPNRRQPYLFNWITNLQKQGLEFEIVVFLTLPSNKGLGAAEQYWIKTLRETGHRLTNLTDGGEGIPGFKHRNSSKERISRANSGENNGMFGGTHTEEVRERIAEACRERVWSEESRQKLTRSKTGKASRGSGWKHSEETCRELSTQMLGNQRALGKRWTQAQRDKHSQLMKKLRKVSSK